MLFEGLELSLRESEMVELVGPNGSGKTTLLRILAGLAGGWSGEVHAGAQQPGWLHYLGHRAALSAGLSPLENLRWYSELQGGRRSVADCVEALSRVGLAGYEDVPCAQLSAGQQRRAALARLVSDDAALWLLDEPLTALDADGCDLVRDLLDVHIRRGGAAVCATHQPLGFEGARRVVVLGAAP